MAPLEAGQQARKGMGGGGREGGALTPQVEGVLRLLDECRRGQGQAFGLMGGRGSWEMSLGFHGRGGVRDLVQQSQVSG